MKSLCITINFVIAVKSMLSNKSVSSKKMILVESQKVLMNDNQLPKTLNNFFSNTITILGIPRFNQSDPFSDNVSDPTLKAILKYLKHPSILITKKMQE